MNKQPWRQLRLPLINGQHLENIGFLSFHPQKACGLPVEENLHFTNYAWGIGPWRASTLYAPGTYSLYHGHDSPAQFRFASTYRFIDGII